MAIFTKASRRTGFLEGEVKRLARINALLVDDVESAQRVSRSYTGNAYKAYQKTIEELARKYDGTADWGCVQAGNIVDVRAAFIIGQGLSVAPVDQAKAEAKGTVDALDFVRRFMEFNDLDREGVQDMAKEAEIEGCFCGLLRWDDKAKNVAIRFLSRADKKYLVKHPADDYRDFQAITWTEGSAQKKLEATEFVYSRFGGRVNKPNEPMPKAGKCLTEIESLSKALRDWREINRLFGSPVPNIECQTQEQAQYIADNIGDIGKNWRLRRVVVTTGKLTYVSPGADGQAGIEREIITLVKLISGATGVPIHFLGMPGELNGRATADNLMELVASSTQKERLIWTGTWQQVIEKAAAIYNSNSQLTPIDPRLVKVSIPAVAPETWARLTDVWLPLYVAGAMSLETLLAQVPGVDPAAEAKRLAVEKAENMARFDRGGDDDEDDEDEDDNGA